MQGTHIGLVSVIFCLFCLLRIAKTSKKCPPPKPYTLVAMAINELTKLETETNDYICENFK
jgi:hypothetical protein